MSIRELNRYKKKDINPNLELISAIDEGKDKKDLVRVAYAIRYGADSNLYVDADGIGRNFHILGYAYAVGKYQSKEYLNTLILLFLVGGSSLMKSAFRHQKTTISEKDLSIGEWLESDGYFLARQYMENGYKRVVSSEAVDFAATLLDIPGMVKNPKSELIAKTVGEKMLSKYKISKKMIFWDSEDMVFSVKYFNFPLFYHLIKNGVIPTYPMVNNILVRARVYKQNENKNEFYVLLDMIKSMLKSGVELDHEQMGLLNNLDEKSFKEAEKVGNDPYWEKVCSRNNVDQKIPPRLKRTSRILGIKETNLRDTCKVFKDASLTNTDEKRKELKQSLLKGRDEEFQSKLKYPNEMVGDLKQKFECANRYQLPEKTHTEYSDLHISSYRSGNGNVWCFTSEYYPSLLEEKINVHNREELSKEFLKEIEFKMDILKELGFSIKEKPPTISETVDDIWEDDKMGRMIVDEVGIVNKLRLNNVDKLTPTKSEKMFGKIGASPNVDRLSGVHARITSLWILDWFYENNREKYRLLEKEMNKL
jgi:hypothetical protein